MKDYQDILFHLEDQVAFLTLNKPPLNILDLRMVGEMVEALSSIRGRKDLSALLIRANGKAFSAGVSVEDHMGDKAEPMLQLFLQLFRLINEAPCATISVVDGAALGGGCELATFCDMVIATDRAKFGQPEINLGVFPTMAVAAFPHLTGLNRTMELLLTGETIPAHKAYEWGLVNRVVTREELEKSVTQLLNNLRSKSALSLSLTRKAVRMGMIEAYNAALKTAEAIYIEELMKTEDAHEGLQSFVDKRAPVWKNR